MKIESYKLKNEYFGDQWHNEVENQWVYKDFKANGKWREGWISFDCALCDEGSIYLGVTSFNNEIAKVFNIKTNKFEDLNFNAIANRYDAKFHRSLVRREKDGCIYAAIALLHCVDHFIDAPGGSIIRYDPKTGCIKKLGIPMPHVYIQSIALDLTQDILYCQCFAPEYLLGYNIETGETINYGLIGTGIAGMAQGENIELDDNGNLWGTWSLTRAWQNKPGPNANRLFKIPAGSIRIEFLDTGLTVNNFDFEKPEGFFNLHDGFIYASGFNSSVFRIDVKTGEAKYLFTPVKDRPSRLASMVASSDGYAYGVVGRDGHCELMRFDYRNDAYKLLGRIENAEGENCYQVHQIIETEPGVFYLCENDNPRRSSYLWKVEI